MSIILILGLLITLSLDFTVGQIGVNYGRLGCRLPPPSKVVGIYQRYGIQRMKIYDTDSDTLKALCGTDINLIVGVVHSDLEGLAASPDTAKAWVQDNICKYPTVNFRHIIVGNEVSPVDDRTSQFAPCVLPAIQNIYDAISAAGLDHIKVTTAIGTGILAPTRYPEDGAFRDDVAPYIDPIVRFLLDTDAPLYASIYPYFAYVDNPKQINIRYALLDPTFEGIVTPSGVRYQNLFHALVDAVYTAVEKSLAATASVSLEASTDDYTTFEVIAGETGWSKNGAKFARERPASIYTKNLVEVVKKGTPKRPDQPVETNIFAMFDEDQKPGNETERHFGIFYLNGQPRYPVDFS